MTATMTSNKPSVLITGAGICGLCSGIALAKAGHRVTLSNEMQPSLMVMPMPSFLSGSDEAHLSSSIHTLFWGS